MFNNNYTYDNTHTRQERAYDDSQMFWSHDGIYVQGDIVTYEGLRYEAIRWNTNETPLLCQTGAWEEYTFEKRAKSVRGISYGNDTSLSYGHEKEDTLYLEYQIKEDIKATLKHFDFKRIKAFNISEDKICTRLLLPSIGNENTQLQWESSATKYLSHQGAVTRPKNGKDYPVWLKLTVSKGDFYASKVFELWISAENKEIVLNEEESVERAYKELDFNDFKGNNQNIFKIKDKLEFSLRGKYGTTLDWLSMQKDLLHEDGSLNTKGLVEDTVVKLHVVIRKGKVQQYKRFYLKLEKP